MWFISHRIKLLITDSLGGGHTHAHAHIYTYTDVLHTINFKKPGAFWPPHARFKNLPAEKSYSNAQLANQGNS